MEITPTNDNSPVLTSPIWQVDRSETSPPTLVFEELTISDLDDSPCNQQFLVAAQVAVVMVAADSAYDVLMVSKRLLGNHIVTQHECS